MNAYAHHHHEDDQGGLEAEIIELIPPCTCDYEGPDDMGNYDLIEDDECPRHGKAT